MKTVNLSFLFAFLFCIVDINSTQAAHTIFTCNFEDADWHNAWGVENLPRNVSLVEEDDALKFKPHSGKALKIRVEKDGHYGTSFGYDFKEQIGFEPEEIYFRYFIRMADDWSAERGGKLPGIAGTYGTAGWGGRPVHGDDGWSARGLFQGVKNGKTPIGFYCYHMDMKGLYGSGWVWEESGFEGLEKNRWHAIQQYGKMNDVGKANGILKAWVDGKVVFEKTDIRFRSDEKLKIENVWINVYLGGKWTAQTEHHLYIDDVAISKTFIE